jgi:hypothetical protein
LFNYVQIGGNSVVINKNHKFVKILEIWENLLKFLEIWGNLLGFVKICWNLGVFVQFCWNLVIINENPKFGEKFWEIC